MIEILKNKKAGFFNLTRFWVEYSFIFILIIGFIVALWSGSAVVTYMIILLSGIIIGRGWLLRKYHFQIPFVLITIAYLVGFVFGSFHGETKYILIFFIVGMYIGYVLHSRELI
ncbi:hypothetical protein HN695_04550 [Candidatus Woesearchaeota archaeon]|nr:hypothetical protein [Candidatus Woesearchaeota archaeon]MBT5271846.1 hypothetical protein [Candidatus Woesearchaeota archaeon]MBT6041690.1 hypothetical protein [Candidatus Woesearchaeota archaeon]MBT6337334.1 hypothetical protein [Candidatus Woesearchaeota archaeon]MBT7927582.1 hypothetical protein [Candidatus Woesearchaeota archaeon]